MLNAKLLSLATAGALALSGATAWAQETIGKPLPDGIHLQPAVTPVAKDMHFFDDMLHVIAIVITIFVCLLLLTVIFRFGAKKNPTPARFTHNAVLEVVWTGVPILILLVIAVFSVPLLFKQLDVPDADVTIKATGNQWYWSYAYPDQEIEFDALMMSKEELAEAGLPKDEYLLATDATVVVPVNANVHVLVTAADVIHAWTVPSFGVKVDAVPGRMNEVWFRAEREGVYYGQCSELCGKDHAFMPIRVKVVSQADYDAWVSETQAALGVAPATKLAAVVE